LLSHSSSLSSRQPSSFPSAAAQQLTPNALRCSVAVSIQVAKLVLLPLDQSTLFADPSVAGHQHPRVNSDNMSNKNMAPSSLLLMNLCLVATAVPAIVMQGYDDVNDSDGANGGRKGYCAVPLSAGLAAETLKDGRIVFTPRPVEKSYSTARWDANTKTNDNTSKRNKTPQHQQAPAAGALAVELGVPDFVASDRSLLVRCRVILSVVASSTADGNEADNELRGDAAVVGSCSVPLACFRRAGTAGEELRGQGADPRLQLSAPLLMGSRLVGELTLR
jgi:hypothetical protein